MTPVQLIDFLNENHNPPRLVNNLFIKLLKGNPITQPEQTLLHVYRDWLAQNQ